MKTVICLFLAIVPIFAIGQKYPNAESKMLDMAIHSNFFKSYFSLCDTHYISGEFIIVDTCNYFKDFEASKVCHVPIVISKTSRENAINVVYVQYKTVFSNYFRLSFFCPQTGHVCGFLIRKKIRQGKEMFKIIAYSSGSF